MVQLDLEDVIPTPQEQITQSETDEFDQVLRDIAFIPSPLWDQDIPAMPADERDPQNVTSAQQEDGIETGREGKGGEEKAVRGESGEDEDEEKEKEKEEKKREREEEEKEGGKETPEISRTDAALLALPFEELTLTEFERVERVFFEQAAAADEVAAGAVKAAKEAEAAAEVERKLSKEKELELLKIPFPKLSLHQFEDIERLFLNGDVPAELIPPIPTRRAPVEKPKQAEVTKAKGILLRLPFDSLSVSDLEEIQSSFSDDEMFTMPILRNKEQAERYMIPYYFRHFSS